MRLHELFDQTLNELRIDNREGWGATGYNMNVDYRGLRVLMRPSKFLQLATPLMEPGTASDIEAHIRAGGAIGAPFLIIDVPEDWFDGDLRKPARIVGHEGRNRMIAIGRVEGDDPVEVHLIFRGEVRRHDITPEMMDALQSSIRSQSGGYLLGPWFEPMAKTNLTELANQPYRWMQTKKLPNGNQYQFQTESGAIIMVSIAIEDTNKPEQTIHVGFAEKVGTSWRLDITGSGNAFRTLATVADITKKFLDTTKYNVQEIKFSGSTSEPSRIKLYDRIASKFDKFLPGWVQTDWHTGDGENKVYTFRRRT